MSNEPLEVNLLAYERRLDQIAAIVEREVHKILIHLAHEIPLSQSSKSMAALQALAVRVAALSEASADGREQGRTLLRLYTERLRVKLSTTGAGPSVEMLRYAQILDQALRERQTLH